MSVNAKYYREYHMYICMYVNNNIWHLQPEGLGVSFFATGPGLGLIMYILTTLEFPTHNFEFHILTTSVNAKYYY